jgi:hypothetical protein
MLSSSKHSGVGIRREIYTHFKKNSSTFKSLMFAETFHLPTIYLLNLWRRNLSNLQEVPEDFQAAMNSIDKTGLTLEETFCPVSQYLSCSSRPEIPGLW